MHSRGIVRLCLALAYLGGLFLALGYVYQYVQYFEGELCVGKDHAENVAACPAGHGGIRPMERDLPLELIPFKDANAARRHFDRDAAYDIAHLPFSLRLDDVVVLEQRPPREVLEVQRGKEKTEYPAKAGTALELDGESATVSELRHWAGLIRNAKGRPIISLSLRPPNEAWAPHLFLETGQWRFMREEVAVRFMWFDNEPSAREQLPVTLPGLESARWGVREGEKTHWVSSFAPETSITISDGTEVTLLRMDMAHEGGKPAILLRAKDKDAEETGWVNANGESRDGTIVFEYPTGCKTVVFVNAWRDGAALVSLFDSGKPAGQRLLQESEVWAGDTAFPYELRLDQVMAGGLPVGESDTPIWEAVIKTREGDLAVREGESLACKGSRVTFRRIPAPPRVRYQFSVLPGEGSKEWTASLSPGGTFRAGEWRFSQIGDNTAAASMAVLRVKRTLGGTGRLLGALMIAVGSLGWVWTRYRYSWRR